MIIILLLVLIIILLNCYEQFTMLDDNQKSLAKLFVYCDKPNIITRLCKKSIYKHCSLSFDIVYLTPETISDYLTKPINIKKELLEKYGGLYLEPNVLVLQNPILVIDRLQSVNTFALSNSILASNKGPITDIQTNQFIDKYDSISLTENKPMKDLFFLEITNANYNLKENDLLFSNTTVGKYLRKSLWLVSDDNY